MSVLTDDQVLPHSDEAERAVIGGIVLDNSQWEKVAASVSSADFYSQKNWIVFNAVADLAKRGSPIDLITIRDTLETRSELEGAGGLAYLSELIDGTARSANVAYYAKIVRDKSVLRRRLVETDRYQKIAMNGATSDEQDQAWADLMRIGDATSSSTALEPASFRDIGNPEVLKVPWLIEGLIPAAGLTIVAAHYKTGKTFLMYRLILDALFGKLALGSFPISRPLKVQLWQFEMPLDINLRRFHKLAKGMGIDPERIYEAEKEGRFQAFIQPNISLVNDGDLRIFHKETNAFGADLRLVDSLSEAFPGIDINKSEQVRPALKAAFAPITAAGLGTIGLHHKRKTPSGGKPDDDKGSILGSQAFGAAARTVYTLDRMRDDKPDIKGRFVVSLAPQGGWDLETTGTVFVIADNATGTETTVDPMKGPDGTRLKSVKPVEQAAIAFAVLARATFHLTREVALNEIQKSEEVSRATAERALKLATEKKWVEVVKVEGTKNNEKEITVGPNTDWEDLQ